MKIRIRDIKQRASLLSLKEQYDDVTGDVEIEYQYVSQLWIMIQNVNHRYNVLEEDPMFVRGKKFHNTYKIFIRYQPDIQPDMNAIGYNGKIFLIKKVDNWQESNRILELLAYEVHDHVNSS